MSEYSFIRPEILDKLNAIVARWEKEEELQELYDNGYDAGWNDCMQADVDSQLCFDSGHEDWIAMARKLAEAIRLTREYVGEELLPAVKGWSWYDAMMEYHALCERSVGIVPFDLSAKPVELIKYALRK